MERNDGSQGIQSGGSSETQVCLPDAHLQAPSPDFKKKIKAKIFLEQKRGRELGKEHVSELCLETNLNYYLNIKYH